MKFSAFQVAQAAQEALDNWDFDQIETGDGDKQRNVLENVVNRGGFSIEFDGGFSDIFDWLSEYASATAADM